MSAKIPQDVTREDRLIGPLTLRQFLFVLGGGSVIFIAYQYYSLRYLYLIEFALISFIFGTLALAFAFAKINGLPFGAFMSHLFEFLLSPKRRRWAKEDEEVLTIADSTLPTQIKNSDEQKDKTTNESQLELLAKVLDTGGKMDENTANANRIGTISADTTTVAEPVVEDVLEDTEN